ncbi:SCP-like protein [Oesophagostomum dentatum]|uniref:SCP-like protein n=1 Tax=Oesophagostomum dentatum TaxID=61180 RepID=A0A0B1SG83_OESDE|nr:SCP-like protein [Oesophagostomum dentatum]
MTDSIRAVFLDMHNKFRSSLARGLEADGLGGNAPKAAKMLKMVYDCDVEASAIKYAKQCYFAHSPFSDRPGLGENLFMTDALNYDKIKAAELASKEWWVELKDYGIGQENILTDALWNRGVLIGHYTQMAWDTTYRLGCAVEHCPDMTYVVCHYGPMGNIMDQLIYTIGEPCSQCPPSYTCSKDEGLCTPA